MIEENGSFKCKGDTIYLVSSSEAVDYLNASVASDFITSLHRISRKGVFHSLVECCKENALGFDITSDSDMELDDFLKGNTRYMAIVTVDEEQEEDFVNFMFAHELEATLLGHVTKGELRVDDESYGFISEYMDKQA